MHASTANRKISSTFENLGCKRLKERYSRSIRALKDSNAVREERSIQVTRLMCFGNTFLTKDSFFSFF